MAKLAMVYDWCSHMDTQHCPAFFNCTFLEQSLLQQSREQRPAGTRKHLEVTVQTRSEIGVPIVRQQEDMGNFLGQVFVPHASLYSNTDRQNILCYTSRIHRVAEQMPSSASLVFVLLASHLRLADEYGTPEQATKQGCRRPITARLY
jgi:hypothetical protein